jgi:hypothetical protein
VLPWLMNLLPEGEPLRAMTRVLGAAPEDVLGLIAETGTDLAGALRIAPTKSPGAAGYREVPDAGALERIITDLPARPFLVDEDGVSMSLAGTQDKLPVALRRLKRPPKGSKPPTTASAMRAMLIDRIPKTRRAMIDVVVLDLSVGKV